ncbi:MAG TPA: NAD-dependent epimerase/dehydratase family protein [Solirubrobacteraceae bacterium]|nr:NAD-dependent epimerase/dehydratase family protein [Solirubrobacteraceae bacterium]
MRTVITGGAGFIGSNLADALVARGHEVTVVDDLSSGKEANLRDAIAAGAVLEVGDVRDAAAMRDLVAATAPGAIVHLAAQIDVRVSLDDPAYDARTNVEGTINMLEAARLAGVPRLVFASTGGAIYGETAVIPTPETVEPRPMAAYGQSKYCAEAYLGLYERLYGISTLALRFGNVYGPRQDVHGEAGVIAIFCGLLRSAKRPKVYGSGEQTRDYIYVADIVEAIATAIEGDDTGRINLGTEEETSVLRIVELLSGLEPDTDFSPELLDARLGEVERSCLDATRARELLGWSARTPIAEGLRLTYAATAPVSAP